MTLKKLALKGGINRERTRYASEGTCNRCKWWV
jgi:hypothetical protein